MPHIINTHTHTSHSSYTRIPPLLHTHTTHTVCMLCPRSPPSSFEIRFPWKPVQFHQHEAGSRDPLGVPCLTRHLSIVRVCLLQHKMYFWRLDRCLFTFLPSSPTPAPAQHSESWQILLERKFALPLIRAQWISKPALPTNSRLSVWVQILITISWCLTLGQFANQWRGDVNSS